jgi:hypothetical protein
MRFSISLLFIFLNLSAFAQKEVVDFDAVDSLYREDQFYLNLANCNLQNGPNGLSQNKLSASFSFGFLRDMPINKNRTWAIAAGLGYTNAAFNQNISIVESNNENSYAIIDADFNKNRLTLHYIDLPLEIRWRNSTPNSHKFWRIYTGFKISYLIYDQYKFEGSGITLKQSGNKDLNKLQYGSYLAAGWNTWNVYIYYGISPIFKDANINSEVLKLNTLNIGLMFYIL